MKTVSERAEETCIGSIRRVGFVVAMIVAGAVATGAAQSCARDLRCRCFN